MRELFEDAFGNEPLDPTESARRNMRPNLRKRFYDKASVGEGTPYPLLLDGRGVKLRRAASARRAERGSRGKPRDAGRRIVTNRRASMRSASEEKR